MIKVFLAIILSIFLSAPTTANADAKHYHGKKILYVNSYHPGYYWSDGEQEGAEKVLANTGVELKIVYMDTKNNSSEEFAKQAGLKVKKTIEEFKPDVLITADDSAFKDTVTPYYRDVNLPVVFCGINEDISAYGAPYKNTTGMIEIALIERIYVYLRAFARGDRVGFLGTDSLSNRKNAEYFGKIIPGGFSCKEFVKDFDAWKGKALQLQEKVDMLIVDAPAGIHGWNEKEVERFALKNIRIPVGTESTGMMCVALIGIAKIAQEHGEYAAQIALRILDGQKPSDIPVIFSKKGMLMLNLKIAEKLNVVFTPAMLKNAKVIIGKEKEN
ncbi:MAG: ABC transporter substrate binding protein [Candidatus Omnitrophota bacterium]|nr:ABC transporter substrate binding protein [Candidatus Omnitrophota bacterium]